MSLFDIPPASGPDERVPKSPQAASSTPAEVLDQDQQALVRALLTGEGPHRNTAFSEGMREVYHDAVNGKGPAELLEDLLWVQRHWAAWLEQAHPALHDRAQTCL